MTSTFTQVFQIVAVLVQVLNAINVASLPPKWQGIVVGVTTVAQAVQGVLAHYQTPAGQTINAATGTVKDAAGDTVAHVPTTK